MADAMGVGAEPGDLEAALLALPGPTDYVNEFRLARCACGSVEFRFHADYKEEVCRRTCVACRAKHWLCDSGQYSRRARRYLWECPGCGESVVNIGVRFLLYQSRIGVWFIVVGLRCVACGLMECPLSWKVAAGPAELYLDTV